MNERQEMRTRRFGAGSGAVCLIFGALVAAVTFLHFSGGIFCSVERSKGANIDHALGLAFVAGLAGPLLLLLGHKHRGFCTTVLLTGAAALGIAIVLVALDSATYAAHQSCGFISTTETDINERVYYLYVLWGASLVFLIQTALSNTSASTWTRRAGTVVPVALMATLALATWAPAKTNSLPAGTKVFAEPNHDHVTGKVRYDRTPPAGGPHNDDWLNCGVYAEPVRNENAVHSLKHGAVWITRPVVASAWGAQLGLRGAADPRLAGFVAHFAGGGQGGEPGGYCTDGTGTPKG